MVGRGKIEFPSPEEPDLQSGALPLTRYLPLFWWFLQVTIVNIPAQKGEASCFYEDNFGLFRRLTSSPQAFKERGSLRTYNYLTF